MYWTFDCCWLDFLMNKAQYIPNRQTRINDSCNTCTKNGEIIWDVLIRHPKASKNSHPMLDRFIPHHLMFFFPPWYPCLWGPLIFVTTPSDSGSQPLEHCSQHIGPEMGGTQRRVGIAFHIDVVPMRFLGWFMIDRRDRVIFETRTFSILYHSVSIFFHIFSYREITQVSFSALRYWRAFTAEGENCWLVRCQS